MRSAAGDYWWPIRGFYPTKARYLHLSESKIGEDFRYAKDHNNSFSGPVEHGERDGKWGVWTRDGTALMLTWDDKMEWHDGDEVSLTGDLVGKGQQFFSPDRDVPSSYSSRLFRVRGSIKGADVTGLAFPRQHPHRRGDRLHRQPPHREMRSRLGWICNRIR